MRYVGDYMAVYATPNDKPFIGRNIKLKRKYGHIDINAELLKQGINLEDIIMSKSSMATKKTTVSLKGVLNIDADEKIIYIVNEDGEATPISEYLEAFNNCEVSLSVNESIDLA